MICQRYRWQIIGPDINLVQSYYTPSETRAGPVSTVVKSYLLAVVVVEAYAIPIPNEPVLWLHVAPFVLVAAFTVATQASPNNRKLSEFRAESEVEAPDQVDNALENSRSDGSSELEDSIAYVYARQSDDSDSDTSGSERSVSIETQIGNGKEAGRAEGYEKFEVYTDQNESGYSFDRQSFRDLEQDLETNPAPVCLDRINRLGRDILETIYVAAIIHFEYDVPIITYRYGKYELDDSRCQMMLVMNAVIAGKSVQDRIQSAWDAIRTRFEDKRIWYTWFDKIPVGYQPDGDWIQPHDKGQRVVSAIMQDLRETGQYSTTVERLQRAAENQNVASVGNVDDSPLLDVNASSIQSVFAAADYDLGSFDGQNLKRMLSNEVYVGEIHYPRNADEEAQEVLSTPELKLVDEDLFEEIHDVIEQISEKYSTSSTDSVDAATLANEGLC